jgi:hypothetical protein
VTEVSAVRFQPALAATGPVAARVRVRFEFRAEGLQRVHFSAKVL